LKLLILDNYDSFTYNLVHLIEKVSTIEFDVVRNDQISLEDIQHFDNILLSPGPGLPSTAGIMPELIKQYGSTKNILGICLGLQAIGEAYGATLHNLEKVCHGQATPIHILEDDVLFKNCPEQFTVGRYHSWVVNKTNLPSALQITAVDYDGNIMALKHKTHNVRGVQFHPESILSEYGEKVIGNWLNSI
jgi:anthranilate synthase component 2